MNDSETRASRLERAVVDVAEAWVLHDRVGERFPATVLSRQGGRVEVQIESPPVRADAELRVSERPLELGDRVSVRLTRVSVQDGKTSFEVVD